MVLVIYLVCQVTGRPQRLIKHRICEFLVVKVQLVVTLKVERCGSDVYRHQIYRGFIHCDIILYTLCLPNTGIGKLLYD